MSKVMSFLVVFLLVIASPFVFGDAKISGTVVLPSKLLSRIVPNGVLFVFAKKVDGKGRPVPGQPPAAVVKIPNPKFPQNFELSSQNVMIPGSKFEGPVQVVARYSPTGDVMPTPQSLNGSDPKNPIVSLGKTGLKIELK